MLLWNKLKESKGYYKSIDIAVTAKLTKDKKNLLIPKKGGKKVQAKPEPKKRSRKPKKGGKFQLKIRQNDADEEEEDKEPEADERPDSGFSSQAGSHVNYDNDTTSELNEDMENENKNCKCDFDEISQVRRRKSLTLMETLMMDLKKLPKSQ